MRELINLGKWTGEKLNTMLSESSVIADPGERISFISGHFIGTKYEEATLVGDVDTPEAFVINLDRVDCLTFIEYVEAMRRSRNLNDFRENLAAVRYRCGEIRFENRNHFFTDWKAFNSEYIIDVTKYLGARRIKEVTRRLNEKSDGTPFIPGIADRLREVAYIQSVYVDESVLAGLKTGDYAGIYSGKEGLDVTHTGILIREENKVNFRHASSLKKNRKVVDEDFLSYLESKPGVIVLRPRSE